VIHESLGRKLRAGLGRVFRLDYNLVAELVNISAQLQQIDLGEGVEVWALQARVQVLGVGVPQRVVGPGVSTFRSRESSREIS